VCVCVCVCIFWWLFCSIIHIVYDKKFIDLSFYAARAYTLVCPRVQHQQNKILTNKQTNKQEKKIEKEVKEKKKEKEEANIVIKLNMNDYLAI
jgi:hypothetical protein